MVPCIMHRILLIRRGGLGDTLLTAPLLRALRRKHDGAALHLAGTREFCDVLCGYGTVDVAHSAEDLLLWIPDKARERLSRFDLIIGDEPPCVQQALDLHSHVTGTPYALQLARQVGCEPEWPSDCQLLPPRSTESVTVLAPGSGGAHKCWPKEHWLALAHRVAQHNRDLEVVVGPAEIDGDDPRAWPWPNDRTTFVTEPEPLRLAKRLESARVFVGNDSGTTHLAAMLGVPTVAVFIATDPTVWAPVGDHVHTIGDADVLPSVDDVERLLDDALRWRR